LYKQKLISRYQNIRTIKCSGILLFAYLFLLTSCTAKKSTTVSSSTKSEKNTELAQQKIDDDFKLRSYFYDACKEKTKGNLDVAQTLLKECLKINPNNAAVNYELGNLYRYTGRYDEALKCAKICALANEKNEWYNILYIECLHNKHLYLEAAARYEVLLKKYPYRTDFYQGLAGEYIYANKPDKAIQAYTRMQQTTGADDDIALQKVKIFTKLKKWNDAEVELKNLIKANPKESRYYTYLADLYQQEGQPQKALETYKDVLKTDSLNPFVHLALADYYRQQHNEEGFFTELKKAFISEDLDIDNKVKILVSYYNATEQNNKLLQQAYELCELLVKQYPDNPKSHSVYADFLYRDKKRKEAAIELKKILEFDKGKYQIWNQLLICESEMNAFDSLAKHSAEAMDLFPDQAVPYYLNGVAYMRLKQYQKAIQALKEGKQFVFENTPLEVEFYSNLGDAYNALKEYDKSDKEYDNALGLDPNNASILNNYAYYLSLRKQNLEKAEKMSKRSLEIAPSSVSYIDTYGWVLYQEQKYDEAKKYLEKAFDRGGFNRPAIVEHYGDVMYKLNEIDKAVENWKKARELGNKSDLLQKKITDKKLYEE